MRIWLLLAGLLMAMVWAGIACGGKVVLDTPNTGSGGGVGGGGSGFGGGGFACSGGCAGAGG
jgi:hypothetical protein